MTYREETHEEDINSCDSVYIEDFCMSQNTIKTYTQEMFFSHTAFI